MDIYVSPSGDNALDGRTPERPIASLIHAQALVRQQIANGIREDVTIHLGDGEYILQTPLIFDERDSPPDPHHVTYRAQDGANPVIYVGQRLVGWQANPDGSYTTQHAPACNILYGNKEVIRKARIPVDTYAYAEAADDIESYTQFRVSQAMIAQINQVEGLQVFIWPGGPSGEWNWFTDIIPVDSVDFETRIVTLKRPARYIIGSGGSRFYLMGVAGFLQETGQFFHDESQQTITCIPHQPFDDQQTVIAPFSPRAIGFVGESGQNPVRNIRLIGLEICCTDTVNEIGGDPGPSGDAVYPEEDGMIYLQNAESITVSGCHLHHAGMHAIFADGWVQHCLFTGNHIHDVGFTGILLAGAWRGIHYVNHHNQITNNLIHDAGTVMGQGSGVQLVQSGHNRIAHNHIHTTSRYAISLKGPHPQHIVYHQIDGVHVREHNKVHLSHTRYNRIEFNDVSNANVDSQDSGVIESWGVYGPDNRIQHNRIHDSLIPFSFGFGIYLDDMASYFTITHNILEALQTIQTDGILWSVFYVKGIGNRFWNNIIANCHATDGVFEAMGFVNDPNRDLEFVRNIVYRSGRRLFAFRNWNDDKFARVDENTFADEDDSDFAVDGIPDATSYADWQRINGFRYDQHSQIAEPRFVDAAHGDYRLRYDSPVYRYDFEDIDRAAIGLTADFPFADPNETVGTLFIVASGACSGQSFISLNPGDTHQLMVMGRTQQGFVANLAADDLIWSSAADEIVRVTDDGRVLAKSSGVARLTATLANDQTVKATFDVLVGDHFEQVFVTAPRTTLKNGEHIDLHVYGRTKHGRYLSNQELNTTFISSAPHIAYVTPEGRILTQRRGTIEITAVAQHPTGRHTASVRITVESVR